MTPRRYLALGLTVVVLAGGVWAAARYAPRMKPRSSDPGAQSAERVTLRFFRDPKPAPAFTAHDLEGRPISSADLRGKVTIVNFWATWCGPCRAEIPDLVALQAKYRDHLQIIGISEDEGPIETVKAFAAEQKINYPVVMRTAELDKLFPGIFALPTSFILDREGRIVQKHVGLLTPETTELETRSLAGLPVNVSIEEVEPGQPIKLDSLAEVTNIPGLDLTNVPAARKAEVLERLNKEACTCGCNLTVAKCRIDDPTCTISLTKAKELFSELTAAP